MTEGLRFRWLGTAGIEFESGGERILVDPYLSRLPMRYLVFGRPSPNREAIARHLLPSRAVLVSHSHFDHLFDVPEICREFGAAAFGSPNSAAILRTHGIPPDRIHPIAAGDSFRAGPFDVRVFAGRHGRMLGLLPYRGKLPARLAPPLRLAEYRMDTMLSFRIHAPGAAALVWNGPPAADVPQAEALFYCPLWGARMCAEVAAAARARVIIPVHWDDFFLPLENPLRPLISPPGWNSPWIRRMDPRRFAGRMKKILPDVPVLVPARMQSAEIPA
ncbi:MAG: MBL fold metallo-hydrolase [Anaerolineales bacterium]|nr:MBL fold metallo-hydrolase [Anaerolineales bacterium]